MANSEWGNIVFYKTKEGKLRRFDPDKAKTFEGKAKVKAIRIGKQSMTSECKAKAKDVLNTTKVPKDGKHIKDNQGNRR